MERFAHNYPELVWLQTANKRRIGLFGGSFNPVHSGHWQCAEGLRKAYNLDRVWWLPTGHNPLKKIEPQMHYSDKLKSIKSYLNNHPHHKVSRLLNNSEFLYTVDFLKFLTSIGSNNQLFWLAGGDILPELHRWKSWQELPKYCTQIFYARPSYCLASSIAARKFTRYNIILAKRNHASSTEVRRINSLNHDQNSL